MAEKKKDIYVGNGKLIKFNNGGSLINFSICLEDIPSEFKETGKNGKTYVKLVMRDNYKGEVDKFGNTHNVIINDYKKPEQTGDATKQPAWDGKKDEEFRVPDKKGDGLDDLPFILLALIGLGSMISMIMI